MKIEAQSYLAGVIDEACDKYVSDSAAFHWVMDQIKDDPKSKDEIMRWGLRMLLAEAMAEHGKLSFAPSALMRPNWKIMRR